MVSKSIYLSFVKPAFDFLFAASLLVCVSPVMLVIASVLKLSGVPVLFVHQRPGMKSKRFGMMKFTTMRNGPSDFRFGRWLRKTSLDELPQLINVVRGEMSLIGPRPLLESYLEVYTAEQLRRHDVKPGITGWAQVNGRNAVDLDRKVALDVYYASRVSFLLDMKILVMTVFQLFRFSEADYHEVVSPKFQEQKLG